MHDFRGTDNAGAKDLRNGLVRTVLAPYILHSEVPLDGESTELIRSKYISGMARCGMVEIKNYQWIRYFYIYLRIFACSY